MRLLAPFVALALVFAVGSTAARGNGDIAGYGLSLKLPPGWHGLAASGQLQAADFPLAGEALRSPELARVPRGHVHLIVWDYGPTVAYLAPNFRPARPPVALRHGDLTTAPLEGFPPGNAYAVRTVTLGEELIEVVAALGPTSVSAKRLDTLNRVLATLRARPPRVLPPSHGRIGSGGVALRLLPGWSGRSEIPANRQIAQLVLRAHRRDLRLTLLELAGGQGVHADLPITLTGRNIHRLRGFLVARRVFATAGRSFDLSVSLRSPHELGRVNRLLRTLTAVPRPWTFVSCDLTLRLPGTWRAAINPRSGCYPVITLRAPGLRVVLTELRARQHAAGRVLRRSGRRFHVRVTPATESRTADAVLATLRAKPRRSS